MKHFKLIIIALFWSALGAYAQSSSDNNNPTGDNHLGWDDTGNMQLRITQNNTNRMLFDSQPIWTGLNGMAGANVNRITLGHNGETNMAWSMLHLWEGPISSTMYSLRRPWMDVGLSMTGNYDYLYLGMMARPKVPITDGNNRDTDMVMA